MLKMLNMRVVVSSIASSYDHSNNKNRNQLDNEKIHQTITPYASTSSSMACPRHLGLCCQRRRRSMAMKLFAFMFVTLSTMVHCLPAAAVHDTKVTVDAAMAAKGLKATRMRSPKIAHIHVLQAVPESLPKNEKTENNSTNSNSPSVAGKYEIHSVSGEPNYKSVNLTWEVEFVPSPQDIITNTSDEIEPPKAFQLYFCELQSFGPHRCRSKIVNGTASQYDNNAENDLDVIEQIRHLRQYAAQVENLRMATKYSFHIRSMPRRKQQKVTGRSEAFENEIQGGDDFLSNNYLGGQTIVIPTKGFSAQATQCLPNASEIEVETGPHFGGKIVVDGGSCGIKGDPNDTKDKYTMRIDHKACGSMMKPETNTVETFITVQENLGIFTHSTRRFVVVCSYQSGLQTVRASFSVPGRGGASAVQSHDSLEEDERMGRGLRPIRYVDKSELILKEDGEEVHAANASAEETQALVQEMENPTIATNQNETNINIKHEMGSDGDIDTANAVAIVENIIPGVNENDIKAKDHQRKLDSVEEFNEKVQHKNVDSNGDGDGDGGGDNVNGMERFSANFAKLILERNDRNQHYDEDNNDVDVNVNVDDGMLLIGADSTPTGRAFGGSTLELISTNMGSVLLTVLLSVILIGVFVFILYRETQRPRLKAMQTPMPMPTPISIPATMATLPRHQHLKETHTLPRTLRTKHRDVMA